MKKSTLKNTFYVLRNTGHGGGYAAYGLSNDTFNINDMFTPMLRRDAEAALKEIKANSTNKFKYTVVKVTMEWSEYG